MALLVVPPLLGASAAARSRSARVVRPGRRRAAEAAVVGGAGRRRRRRRRARPGTYDRVVRIVALGLPAGDDDDRGRHRPVARDPGRRSSCSWPWPACSSSSSTTCCRPDALGPAKFVVEGSVAITVATLLVALTGGVGEPVLLRLPADRRRRGARGLAARSRSALARRREPRLHPGRASAGSPPASSATGDRRRPSGSTSPR